LLPVQKAISCQYNEAESMELLERSHVGKVLIAGKGGEGWRTRYTEGKRLMREETGTKPEMDWQEN